MIAVPLLSVRRPWFAVMVDFCVFVVDDDPWVLGGLLLLLRANGIAADGYSSAGAFLERPAHDGVACLILDLRLAGCTGLDVQDALRQRGDALPIVFLSGEGDVRSTARAMRAGAVDFLVKPVDEPELLAALGRARDRESQDAHRRDADRLAAQRLARLTPRERQVCDGISRGLLNKQIAGELGTSENTVKVHRARVMRKLGVDSVAALVRLTVTDTGHPVS
jgi:FixJ family two-component response regulator